MRRGDPYRKKVISGRRSEVSGELQSFVRFTEFRYDPKVCRFKTWLLNQTSWRIKDQLKKRQRASAFTGETPANAGTMHAVPSDETSRTETINRVPDPNAENLDALFEAEWRKNLFATALERVRGNFSLKQFQIFDLIVQKEWPAADVAHPLGVSLANVYVTKNRIAAAVKREVKRLERTAGGVQELSKSPQ